MSNKISAIGTVAYDSVETPFGSAPNALGGSATYISLAASYFCNSTSVIGIVGGDFNSFNVLTDRGINTSNIEVKPDGKTFHWAGRYHSDMNNRDTLDTQLNVLLEFNPIIKDEDKDTQFVCLGNVDPKLQVKALRQFNSPKFVMCDTMNFWIELMYADVLEIIKNVDCLVINDSEARELTKEHNLIKASEKILEMGCKFVVIKKGEHGALLFSKDGGIFIAPAFPLLDIVDPTGAGDSFAGGMIGYLSQCSEVNELNIRRSLIYGTVMASFCCSEFSVGGLLNLTKNQIKDRAKELQLISNFDFSEDSY
jgi:sugar/nucleoside kinase (ribokinase family)